MEEFKNIAMEVLGPSHAKDPESKSNQIFYLREHLANTVIQYARTNRFTEQQFEVAFKDSLSILDGLHDSFEPYRQSAGDAGAFWTHQYINVDQQLSSQKNAQKPVHSANGLLDDYVEGYISQPAMHSLHLTRLLLDAYFYNDTINLIETVKADRRQRNIIKPSMGYALTALVMQLSRIGIATSIGALIYKNTPELLTPYVLVYLYWRYKVMRIEPAKELIKNFFKHTVERYTHLNGKYHFEQMVTELRTSHEKYGTRYHVIIHELVDLLK